MNIKYQLSTDIFRLIFQILKQTTWYSIVMDPNKKYVPKGSEFPKRNLHDCMHLNINIPRSMCSYNILLMREGPIQRSGFTKHSLSPPQSTQSISDPDYTGRTSWASQQFNSSSGLWGACNNSSNHQGLKENKTLTGYTLTWGLCCFHFTIILCFLPSDEHGNLIGWTDNCS